MQSIENSSNDLAPDGVYYHNYLFPHNEKRCYRNKLTFVGENTVYLGVTLKDKTDRHWKPAELIKVTTQNKDWPLIGNNAPVGFKHSYEHNGLVLSFKRPKLLSYFTNILQCGGEVKYLGLQKVETVKASVIENNAPTKKISRFERLRRQFDSLPKGDKYCCYCEVELNRNTVTRDHLIPRSRGGGGEDYGHENIKPCCSECNTEKGNLMLHSYIQLLNLQMQDKHGQELIKLQTKIINANKLAKNINNKTH